MSAPARPDSAANTTVFDDDESIPLLTERLTLPALDLDFALPTLEQVVQVEQPATTPLPPPAAPPPPSAEALRDAVLKAVLERLPAEIETRVHQQLRPAVDAAVAHLAAEANQAVRDVLAQMVERAVREALGDDTPVRP